MSTTVEAESSSCYLVQEADKESHRQHRGSGVGKEWNGHGFSNGRFGFIASFGFIGMSPGLDSGHMS